MVQMFTIEVSFWGYEKSWPDGAKRTSDLNSATPKTYNKHGLVSGPGSFFLCGCVICYVLVCSQCVW